MVFQVFMGLYNSYWIDAVIEDLPHPAVVSYQISFCSQSMILTSFFFDLIFYNLALIMRSYSFHLQHSFFWWHGQTCRNLILLTFDLFSSCFLLYDIVSSIFFSCYRPRFKLVSFLLILSSPLNFLFYIFPLLHLCCTENLVFILTKHFEANLLDKKIHESIDSVWSKWNKN